MKINISDEIKKVLPSFDVIAYTMDVENNKSDEVTKYIDEVVKSVCNIYTLKNSPFQFLFVSIFPLTEGIE